MIAPRLACLALILALAACGGSRTATTVDNRGSSSAAADPVVALEALARAIETDDGVAFASLVDPGGLTIWYTPGAGYAVFDTVAPGDTAKPSAHDGPDLEVAAYWREEYWRAAARAIRDGLTHLDRDPADPSAPIYGTCAEEEVAELRAYLAGGRDDSGLRSMDLGGDGEVDPAAVRRDLTVFHTWGFAVYLARSAGGWRAVHLVMTDPCSA